MVLPTLSYPPVSQNQRVASYAIGSDEQPWIFDATISLTDSEKSELIQAAYRQIFHEQHMLEYYRQPFLESQLRCYQITVRDFIEGLTNSDAFKRLNYESNSNYRFVEICIQRILGREVFHDQEKITWSIVLATQGVKGFISALLNSEEYLTNFGESIVPYQRSRILPQQVQGRLPFARMARYDLTERPDLATKSAGGFRGERIDMSALGDVGKDLFVSAFVFLIAVVMLMVAGAATGL
ncbi:MAG: phycobilisome rod-core linker polypeptide [Cyanobacteria bacterium P01_F01_bin.53]